MSKDTIYRQAAIDAIKKIQIYVTLNFGKEGVNMPVISTETALNTIQDLPAAQPEIVRCTECKHRHEVECPMYHEEDIEWDDDGYIERETIYHDWTEDDGYCDRGERKTDGEQSD